MIKSLHNILLVKNKCLSTEDIKACVWVGATD